MQRVGSSDVELFDDLAVFFRDTREHVSAIEKLVQGICVEQETQRVEGSPL